MRIAVASGKGGTGKTTISLNLARTSAQKVSLFDCDVEEPNAHLFLNGTVSACEVVTIPIPLVDESRCNGCGECGKFCEYNAIVSFGTIPLVFAEMCHGCGGCMLVCPQKAISEVQKRIGTVDTIKASGINLVMGKLDVGVAMAPPLIAAVKAKIDDQTLSILDAPPGTSCPVIATLRETDYVVLVTEPTPFGLNDLCIAVDMVRELGLPFGVVVNRMGVGDDRVHLFCSEQGIPILAEVPDDRRIAVAYSNGQLIVDALPEYRSLFEGLLNSIISSRELSCRK